ncbi:uncharacterized protein LOC135692987, partial [Rhopilema esculentum]|uniref:uncharacterized protein LOC135692987 n=1 Tax=Rhopilema esculentum TaxID=499914 RepID=UPI0031D60118
MQTVKIVLQDELQDKVIDTFYWTDSYSTLCWIRNVKPWTQYVRNRVSKILSTSKQEKWFHCPGVDNPADLPSRGKHGGLAANSFWWEGPQFLKLEPQEWPKSPNGSELVVEEALQERVKQGPIITHAIFTSKGKFEELIDIMRFNDKGKLVRSFGWVISFFSNLKSAVQGTEINRSEGLSAPEIQRAETVLIRSVQHESFSSEIKYLLSSESGKKGTKTPLYINQFNLFLDKDMILRCRTRVGKSTIAESSKRPVFLPAKSKLSELIIKDCHDKVFHNGVKDTLNLMRQRYWVLRGREQVRKLVRRCILCKRLEGLPFKTVYSPELPEFRIDSGPPFTNVGIDFAGPLMVTGRWNKDEQIKCYLCLFTCAATRAVHLEVVESLSVEDFICAYRRFSARRGTPSLLISDNAKTFKSASKEITKLLRSPKLTEYFTIRGVKWKFIVELAPFYGGFWERLIRSTKRCLTKVVGRATLSYGELETIVVEIER